MWGRDKLSSSMTVPGLGLVIATRCFVCVGQQRGLQDWEGSAEDWVEEPSLRADKLVMSLEIPQVSL